MIPIPIYFIPVAKPSPAAPKLLATVAVESAKKFRNIMILL
jgi:hypothetical protein